MTTGIATLAVKNVYKMNFAVAFQVYILFRFFFSLKASILMFIFASGDVYFVCFVYRLFRLIGCSL